SIMREVRYPEMARRAGIEGRVYVQFIVNEQGDVENPRVIRGIGGGADEEALRVVSQAQFKPGMQRGRPVRVQYSLPIFFRLEGSETTPEQSSLEPRDNRLNEMTVVGYGGNTESRTQIEPEIINKEMKFEIYHLENGIRGRILDKDTGEPLTGANVSLVGTNRGAATNLEGYFELRGIESNEYSLEFSYIGYATATMNASR
ncbi:MAG: TonB family protein, partial [Balneolaceae bacterium]|nr:TonB family protein [Balneolaceae bacterium]